MPLISLSLSHQLSEEDLAYIARSLTDVTENTLKKDPAVTRVDIGRISSFLNRQNVEGLSYSLSVSITEGTNSKEECASWLDRVHNLMGEYSSEDSVNYITINEIPGHRWGYNGLSQQSRKTEA